LIRQSHTVGAIRLEGGNNDACERGVASISWSFPDPLARLARDCSLPFGCGPPCVSPSSSRSGSSSTTRIGEAAPRRLCAMHSLVPIIAATNVGATVAASTDIFLLAIRRASEICIGIACAQMVLAGTDLCRARRRLAAPFVDGGRFTRTLRLAGSQISDMQPGRRGLPRRVTAVEPAADQALGESSQLRPHRLMLERAVYGLLRALDGWRATHLSRHPTNGIDLAKRSYATFCSRQDRGQSPPHQNAGCLIVWRRAAFARSLRGVCEEGLGTLLALPVRTPSRRLLAVTAAKILAGRGERIQWASDARRWSCLAASWPSRLPAQRITLAGGPEFRQMG
jgi:hypothetical protein